MERELLLSSPWDPGTGLVGMVQSCGRGDSDLILGSISLTRGWSNAETGFLERWSMPHACQCLKKSRLDNALNNRL